MARINLLTIHWGCSYGGTMQAYATIKILQELGHQVTLINLVHPKFKKTKINFSPRLLWTRARELQFYLFRKFYFCQMTKIMYEIDNRYIPECDYTIVGSDQVWNSDITYPIHLSYFLDFKKTGTKLSYASSFGKYVWENNSFDTNVAKTAFSTFKAISVREESGVEICRDIFGVNAVQILDPTLVYNHYNNLINNDKIINELFPFLLMNNDQTKQICNFVSEELNLPIYKSNRFKFYFGRSPKEWLRRIKNSTFIITDSFHGLAFSIIFHKNFLVVCADNKKFTRLQSLLALLHLEDRYVLSLEDLQRRSTVLNSNINYKAVDVILEKEREKAISFLKQNLS